MRNELDIETSMHLFCYNLTYLHHKRKSRRILSSKSELSEGEVGSLGFGSLTSDFSLVLSEGESESSGLLVSQVSGEIFLALEGFSDLLAISLVDNSQIFSNGLSDNLLHVIRTVNEGKT